MMNTGRVTGKKKKSIIYSVEGFCVIKLVFIRTNENTEQLLLLLDVFKLVVVETFWPVPISVALFIDQFQLVKGSHTAFCLVDVWTITAPSFFSF